LHQTISQPGFHVNKVNMDNRGLKSRASVRPVRVV
jgi:hypothetical protein